MIKRVLLVYSALVASTLTFLSFCGYTHGLSGNKKALRCVEAYVYHALESAKNNPEGQFRVVDELPDFYPATSDSCYLVSTAPVSSPPSGERRVIIVCNTPFTDLPERLIFKSPPMHAVGYSDGTEDLIPPADYARLNLASFVPLKKLIEQHQSKQSGK